MNKARILSLIGVNTFVIYGLILFLMPENSTQQLIVIGITMALMTLAPILVINKALNSLEKQVAETTAQNGTLQEELDGLREKFSTVTTLDELTGCYNEKHFLEVLLQHRAMSERGNYEFSLVVLQVDQFAGIVDDHGLGPGNETLQLFTRIVKAALREVDVLARLHSDIFAVILSGASEEDSVMIINRISQLISQIKIVDDEDLKVTVSGGITTFHGTESPQDLVEHATTALEFAIEQGRDCVAGYNYKPPEELAGLEPEEEAS